MASEFHDQLVEQLPRLRAYAMSLTRHRAQADDLVQQTALKAWNAQASFTAGTNFKAWLYHIMRNEHISSFRRNKRPQVSIDVVPEEVFAREGDQENKLMTKEVFAAMDKLAKVQREVLLMNCVAGLSYEEIAETLGCSIGTVKSRLWRARNEMQKLIYGTGEEAADGALEADSDADEKPARKEMKSSSVSLSM
jgi:RNA polymerase sigma-70 factor (ECF subfamily)